MCRLCANTIPVYMRDLSILEFGYPMGILEPILYRHAAKNLYKYHLFILLLSTLLRFCVYRICMTQSTIQWCATAHFFLLHIQLPTLVTWNLLWWRYLHPGNFQIQKIRLHWPQHVKYLSTHCFSGSTLQMMLTSKMVGAVQGKTVYCTIKEFLCEYYHFLGL